LGAVGFACRAEVVVWFARRPEVLQSGLLVEWELWPSPLVERATAFLSRSKIAKETLNKPFKLRKEGSPILARKKTNQLKIL